MAEQRKFTAQIARKGLDATGVTEDHARQMAATLGGHTMLIVEARHNTMTTDAEGNQQVVLTLTGVEPVPAELEDKVRDLQRALYRQRPDVLGQAALEGTAEGTTPEQALGQLDPEVWDGNPDTPLAVVPDPPEGGYCPAPGCDLEDGHDGDHATSEDDGDTASDG